MNHKTPMVRLGDYIEVCNERNYDLRYDASFIEGVNSDGTFCPTKAQTIDIDLKPYKIVRNGDFVYNPSRLNIGSLSYRRTGLCIVSHLYVVFHLNSKGQQLIEPCYLWLFFKRDEFKRLIDYRNFGSQRPEFNFYQMCEIEIPLPSIEVQRDLVEIYEGLEKIVSENEVLTKQMESICHDFIVDCNYKYPKVILGDWIEECDERNRESLYPLEAVRGISTEKAFIATKANMDGVSLLNYKIAKIDNFAYNPSRINLGSIALNKDKTYIVSPMYIVFRIKDECISELVPDFLTIWFSRPEFNRSALFYAAGSVRDVFGFKEMQSVTIPLPPKDVQDAIVAIHRCAQEYKAISQKTKLLMKTICPALVQKAAQST